MAFHKGVTLVTEIQPEQLKTLEGVLQDLEEEFRQAPEKVPFQKMGTVHFARWVIIYDRQDIACNSKHTTPASLLYTASVDGFEKDHLTALVATWPEGMDRIYGCCKDYPTTTRVNPESASRWLNAQRLKSTFYSGIVGMSLTDVRREGVLYERIQGYLDTLAEEPDIWQQSSLKIRERVQSFVQNEPDLAWALVKPKLDGRSRWQIYGPLYSLFGVLGLCVLLGLLWVIHQLISFLPPPLVWVALAGGLVVVVLVVFLAMVYVGMRLDEGKERKKPLCQNPDRSDENIRDMLSAESNMLQTHYSAVEFTKGRAIRYVWQTVILWVVTRLSPTLFVPTVHAARWFQIPNKTQVLFVTNFDGDSESYLHAFIDRPAIVRSMNLMYGSTVGFPTTRGLIRGGAESRSGYMHVTRVAQAKTNVWYCAVPNLSVENKKNNRQVRLGLSGSMTEAEAQDWLRKF